MEITNEDLVKTTTLTEEDLADPEAGALKRAARRNAERQRDDAVAYSRGEIKDKPENFDHWKNRLGLEEPKAENAMKPVEKSETMSPSTETTRLQGAESSKAVEKETAQGNGQGELAFGEETPEQREAREKQERVDKAASLRSRHAQLSEGIKQKQLEYRFMNDRKKQYQARKELEKFYDEIEGVERQLKETGEPMQVKRFERPAKKERTQHAARKAYDEMKKKYANDDEVMGILNNTDPQDIYEEIGIALGSSKLLFKSKGEGASRKRGVAEETGWKWNDVKGMFQLFDNEKGQSVSEWAETFWADLDEGAKNRYSDSDIKHMMLDVLSGASTIGDLRNIVLANRVRQAEELLEHREKEEEYWRDMERHEQEMRDTEEEAMLEHIKDLDENFDEQEYYSKFADEILKEQRDDSTGSNRNLPQGERGGFGNEERNGETGKRETASDRDNKDNTSAEVRPGETGADSQEDGRASRRLDSQRVSQERGGLSAKEREIVNRVNAGINEAIDDLDAEIRDLEKKGDEEGAEAARLEKEMLENSREDMIDDALAEYDDLQGIKRGTRAEQQAAERREKSIADRKAKRMRELLEKLRDPNTSDVKRRAVVRQLADLGVDASGYLDSASQNGLEVRDEGLENEETRKRADEEQGNEDGLSTRYQKTDGTTQELSAAEKALRDGLVDVMRGAGIEVVTDEAEGQRVLDAANRAADVLDEMKKRNQQQETALPEDESSFKGTAISSADGAKVIKNLDTLAKESENISTAKKRTFLGDIADALGAKRYGSKSRYLTVETINGNAVTIRLADHNATVSNFDHSGRENGISIVVSRKPNAGITNDGEAHIVEFFYPDKALRKSNAHPYAEIVRSLQQTLYSGEYKDTTGLAERQEVNEHTIREMRGWHGSGADFDAFEHAHMGEGEGAQAYGWGTYVTQVEGIARGYAGVNGEKITYQGKLIDTHNRETLRDACLGAVARQMVMNGKTAGSYINEHIEFLERDVVRFNQMIAEARSAFEKGKATKLRDGAQEVLNEFKSLNPEDFTIVQKRYLYEVEIPDNDGTNYVSWNKTLPKEHRRRVADVVRGLPDELLQRDVHGPNWLRGGFEQLVNTIEREQYAGKEIIERLKDAIGDSKKVSEILSKAGFVGIEYPAQYRSGGRSDGAKNYVIFNEKDIKIVNKTQLFRTANGEVYGFVRDGKIYLDPKLASSETAVHEYTHLWSEALRANNPKAWEQLKSELLKDKETMDVVKKLYPELEGDALMDEVFSQFSGKRGAERLRAERERLMAEADTAERKGVVARVFDRIKGVLDRYWNMARDLMAGKTKGIEKLSAEDFADMALNDLLRGEKPDAEGKQMRENRATRYEKMARGYETASRNTERRDREYAEAVERGDTKKVQRMLEEEAERKGYSSLSDYQGTSAFNGAAPARNGYYDTREERKAASDREELEGDVSLGDFVEEGIDLGNLEWSIHDYRGYRTASDAGKESILNLRQVVDSKKKTIKMYRSVPSSVYEGSFRNGDWVTPSRKYAEENAWIHGWGDNYRIIEQEVPIDNIWWDGNDINEWGYDDGKGYVYKNTVNNRKLFEITYDDNGNLIPLSERFNTEKQDIRYLKKGFADKTKTKLKQEILSTDNVTIELPTDQETRKLYDDYKKNVSGWRQRMIDWITNTVPSQLDTIVGKVAFSRGSARDAMAHGKGDLKMLIVPHIEKMLKTGVVFDTNNDGEFTYYNIAHRVRYDNEDYVARFVIREDRNRKRYYDHEFTEIKKVGELPTAQGRTSEGSDHLTHQPAAKILQEILLSKPDSKKNDINAIQEAVEAANAATMGKARVVREADLGKDVPKNAQAWYDPNTGEVHVVAERVNGAEDASRAVWHEEIGHKAMSELLGDRYDEWLDDVPGRERPQAAADELTDVETFMVTHDNQLTPTTFTEVTLLNDDNISKLIRIENVPVTKTGRFYFATINGEDVQVADDLFYLPQGTTIPENGERVNVSGIFTWNGLRYKIMLTDIEPTIVTAISDISTKKDDANSPVFTITGINLGNADLQSLPAGIYIKGGKKIIVR